MADGFDAARADKMNELKKFKRTMAWKKLRGLFVLCSLLLCMAMLWICFRLEVSLPAMPVVKVWRFCSSHLFLFMVIHVIVIVLVVKSGSLRPSNGQEDFYDEFVRRSQAARKDYQPVVEIVGNSEAAKATEVSGRPGRRSLETAKSFSGAARPRGRKLRRSESAEIRENCEEAAPSSSLIVMEVPSNEEAMPAEELQRRSEEFIAKINRQIRQEILEFSG